MQVAIVTATAAVATVTATTASFSTTLNPYQYFRLVSTTNIWVKQGNGAQTAVAATAGNTLVVAGQEVLLSGNNGDTVAVIRDSVDGKASLTIVQS